MAKADIVKDYDWTSIPKGSCLRKVAPRVAVRSYKLTSNQVITRFASYIQVVKDQDTETFYEKLYGDSTVAEDDFNFPYFNDNLRSFTNTFSDTFQNGFGGGGGIGEAFDAGIQALGGNVAQLYTLAGAEAFDEAIAIASSKGDYSIMEKTEGVVKAIKSGIAQGGNPGSYIETPKMYQYEESDSPLEVSFILSNTINPDYSKNTNLVKHLTKICRPFRKNAIAMDPPRIFRVKVPGQRFIKWASCNNFSVNTMGTKRMIDDVLTPEAYQITMSFQSLTVEVANFMDQV